MRRSFLRISASFPGAHGINGMDRYCVSTVGLDEDMIRAYVRHQDELDQQLELDLDN
jgi:hypothetical protein